MKVLSLMNQILFFTICSHHVLFTFKKIISHFYFLLIKGNACMVRQFFLNVLHFLLVNP